MNGKLRSWTLFFLHRGLHGRPFKRGTKFCLAEDVRELESKVERLEIIEAEVEKAGWWREWLEIKNQAAQPSSGNKISEGKKTRELIDEEVCRARKKYNWWAVNPVIQAAIVADEAGELLRASLKLIYKNGNYDDFRKEAIQTAAMCIRLLEGG